MYSFPSPVSASGWNTLSSFPPSIPPTLPPSRPSRLSISSLLVERGIGREKRSPLAERKEGVILSPRVPWPSGLGGRGVGKEQEGVEARKEGRRREEDGVGPCGALIAAEQEDREEEEEVRVEG